MASVLPSSDSPLSVTAASPPSPAVPASRAPSSIPPASVGLLTDPASLVVGRLGCPESTLAVGAFEPDAGLEELEGSAAPPHAASTAAPNAATTKQRKVRRITPTGVRLNWGRCELFRLFYAPPVGATEGPRRATQIIHHAPRHVETKLTVHKA